MAQPRLELLDRILSWYFETQNSAKIDTRRLIACLLVWMKRLVEVNEELPRIFPRSYNEGG
jgi:hypothetical protein